jgi:hypothetical protein
MVSVSLSSLARRGPLSYVLPSEHLVMNSDIIVVLLYCFPRLSLSTMGTQKNQEIISDFQRSSIIIEILHFGTNCHMMAEIRNYSHSHITPVRYTTPV